jgi:septum formation inhibitor MinC
VSAIIAGSVVGGLFIVAVLMLLSAGKQVVKWEKQMEPAEVRRRAWLLIQRQKEKRIAETHKAALLAIDEAVKRHRQSDSA